MLESKLGVCVEKMESWNQTWESRTKKIKTFNLGSCNNLALLYFFLLFHHQIYHRSDNFNTLLSKIKFTCNFFGSAVGVEGVIRSRNELGVGFENKS